MFRYLNEIQSGRTSSISHEIVGNVMLVVSATAGVVGMTQGELCRGEKIKLLFRHLIFRASRFLGIAVALEVPFFVVITKVNMVPEEQLKKISDTVASILKSAGAAKARRCRLWWTLATTASRRPAPASTAQRCGAHARGRHCGRGPRHPGHHCASQLQGSKKYSFPCRFS